jgi:hypothetical protein
MKKFIRMGSIFTVFVWGIVQSGVAQDPEGASDEELAIKLANPISSMISVPFDFGYNTGFGPKDGDQLTLSLQPVVPFTLSEDLSLVIRTIVPIIGQDDIAGNSGSQFGLGDTLQSFFLVPNSQATKLGTLTYGVGPAVLWPTSTDRLLGAGTLGAGPTGVVLFQKNGWTYGMLANHIWGVSDTRNDKPDLSITFLQPFFVYTKNSWSFVLQTESVYDWTTEEWAVPINTYVSKLITIGGQKVQIQVGPRYWVEEAEGGPDGVGGNIKITWLFPK